jgi:CubicO group peptidase (beta-lactamase class C family)
LRSAHANDANAAIRRGEFGAINSLLIVRNERLVVEEYFNGWLPSLPHTQQSITKSVTSLAAGLAIDRGQLRLSDLATARFPDYEPIRALDTNKQALTVRDLLMMRTGFDWSEQTYAGSPLQRLNDCACDWLRFILDWPLREPPGARWEYVSGGVILLGAIIGRASGSIVCSTSTSSRRSVFKARAGAAGGPMDCLTRAAACSSARATWRRSARWSSPTDSGRGGS